MAEASFDAELIPLVIKGSLEEKLKDPKSSTALGAGSYGFIYEVQIGQVSYIAKKPHTVFSENVSKSEKESVIKSFRKECVILSKLRHPNIVPFIGVYYGKDGVDDIAMVMQKLECDLAEFLENSSNISDLTKLSILQDVSYGLVYLHEYNPPIIHRDLTARNVLLTKGIQAKIADVGVAKLMDQAALASSKYTSAPGNLNYMPPEALMEKADYTVQLDIFSFGHLSLHVLIGDYPKVFEVQITSSMLQQGLIQKQKRQQSIDQIQENHALLPLTLQCLNDYPERRPTTRALNTTIIQLMEVSKKFFRYAKI